MGDVDGGTQWRAVRIVLGLQFLVSGLFSAVSWSDTVSFNETLAGTAGAPVFTAVGAALLILGGLLLIVGYRVRAASIAVVVFLVPATIRHFMIARDIGPDLALADLAERGQLSSGVKNLALIAVMLLMTQHDHEDSCEFQDRCVDRASPVRSEGVGTVPATRISRAK